MFITLSNFAHPEHKIFIRPEDITAVYVDGTWNDGDVFCTHVSTHSFHFEVKETQEEVVKLIEEYTKKTTDDITNMFSGLANLGGN